MNAKPKLGTNRENYKLEEGIRKIWTIQAFTIFVSKTKNRRQATNEIITKTLARIVT